MLRSRLSEAAVALPGAVEEALQAAAEEIAQSARARVPVETGRLQRAIHTQKTDDGVEVIAGDKEAWYGFLVEHGHHGTTGMVPPHPFLLPALEENRERITREIEAAVRRAVT